MKPVVFLIMFLSLQCLTFAEVTVQGQPDDARAFLLKGEARVTLHGQASTTIEATEVHASVQVTGEGANYSAAIDSHEDQKEKLIKRLEAVGIPRGQVKAPKFATVNSKISAGSGSVIGYTAEGILVILLQEQKQYVELLGILDQVRQAKLVDLTYNHTLLTDIHKQILANACKSVMNRKEVYEQNLGVTLRPISFTEDEGSERPMRFDRASYGQIPIKAGVQVVFAVTPGAPPPPPKSSPAQVSSPDR
jgi:uncharacterized protein YggE